MGSRWGTETETVSRTDLTDQARAFFEIYLHRLGLGEADIQGQSLDQLRISLRDLNSLIDSPAAVGTFRVSSTVTVLLAKPEVMAEIGPLPLLLERRRQIEGRIRQLEAEHLVVAIQEEIVEVEDAREKQELAEKLRQAEAERDRVARQAAELQQRREAEEAASRRAQERVEIQAKRAAIYQSWLARESMASLIGGILLLLFGFALILAMFTKTPVAEILGNAFLLVLGYFFGQSATQSSQK